MNIKLCSLNDVGKEIMSMEQLPHSTRQETSFILCAFPLTEIKMNGQCFGD